VRASALVREYDVRIRYTVFPLHPETPEEGLDLEDLFRGRNLDIPRMQARLRQVAAEVGLPIGDRRTTCNSRKAQELLKWAEDLGRGDALRAAVYRVYFVEGKNIAREEVLAGAAEEAGLSGADAGEALRAGRYAAAVDADWTRARALGVTAVPTFVTGGRLLVGFHPYAELAKLAEKAGAVRRIAFA
jgi:predicted DsbA family dithiol-disulfide isomerase